jgi:hypothetical protein
MERVVKGYKPPKGVRPKGMPHRPSASPRKGAKVAAGVKAPHNPVSMHDILKKIL